MIKCQAALDPSLWRDFPVKLTIVNMDSFFEIKRSTISFSRYHGVLASIFQNFFEVKRSSIHFSQYLGGKVVYHPFLKDLFLQNISETKWSGPTINLSKYQIVLVCPAAQQLDIYDQVEDGEARGDPVASLHQGGV